jgi:hypothetical protein
MKTSQRHHLKDNELALALGHANVWATRNRRPLGLTLAVIAVLVIAAAAFAAWRNSVDAKARTMLAEAMVVQEARVVPPTPPDPAANVTPGAPVTPAAPQPGTYPTEKAKLDAALPKFLAADGAVSRRGHPRPNWPLR